MLKGKEMTHRDRIVTLRRNVERGEKRDTIHSKKRHS